MSGQHRRPLVVGVDDTSTGRLAVRWAVEEAARRGSSVRVISAYEAGPAGVGTYAEERTQPPAALRERFDDAVAYAAGRLGRERVEGRIVAGRPVDLLVNESRAAELVVVGGRACLLIDGLVSGSTGCSVAAGADCSVVVVHPRMDRDRPRIVVGVDPSAEADVALAAAFDAAESQGLPLDVLHCWQPCACVDHPPHERDAVATARRERERWLAEKVAHVAEKHPVVPVTTHLVEGRPGEQLAYRSETAALVVVGSHGHGRAPRTLLGSVSQYLLHHARSSVMVAREHGN